MVPLLVALTSTITIHWWLLPVILTALTLYHFVPILSQPLPRMMCGGTRYILLAFAITLALIWVPYGVAVYFWA